MDLYRAWGIGSTHTPFNAHYFYQGAWLARTESELVQELTSMLILVASVLTIKRVECGPYVVQTTVCGFSTAASISFGLNSIAGNILDLPFRMARSIHCRVCTCSSEHIGLGRYGDPLDPQGSVKAAWELQRIVNSGGKLFPFFAYWARKNML